MTDEEGPAPSNAGSAGEVLDLTAEPVGPPSAPPQKKPYDPSPHRERMRGIIVLTLLGILAGIIAAAFIALWLEAISSADLQTLLNLVFSPIIGLVGAAAGFYYGGRSEEPS